MHEPIQQSISQSRFIQILMPSGHGALTGHHGGLAIMPIIKDLEQVTPAFGGQRCQPPIIQDQQLGFRLLAEQARIATIGPGERQVGQKPRQPEVARGVALAAGLLRQRTG